MAGGRKPKSTELKAFKYKVVMEKYAGVFAPIVANSAAFIRTREALWASVRAKVSAKVSVDPMTLRQMFMTFWSLYKKGVFNREAVEAVLKAKYNHLPASVIDDFLDAVYG